MYGFSSCNWDDLSGAVHLTLTLLLREQSIIMLPHVMHQLLRPLRQCIQYGISMEDVLQNMWRWVCAPMRTILIFLMQRTCQVLYTKFLFRGHACTVLLPYKIWPFWSRRTSDIGGSQASRAGIMDRWNDAILINSYKNQNGSQLVEE